MTSAIGYAAEAEMALGFRNRDRIISPRDFENDGEIEFPRNFRRIDHPSVPGKLMLRRTQNPGHYEVYVYYSGILTAPKEEIRRNGTLRECVEYVNKILGTAHSVPFGVD